jgi:oxygen-dependent protoporphyrinogen oxidase
MVELEQEHGGLFRALMALGRARRRDEKAGGTGGPTGVLTSFRGGMESLPRALVAGLNGRVLTGQRVTGLERDDTGWHVRCGDRSHGPFDAVVDSAPAHAAAGYHPDGEVRRLLAGIRYNPLVVIGVALRREDVVHPLDGFGMLTPSTERRPLLGVLWTSSIWTHRAPAGTVLLRCMAGDPDWVDLADDEVLQRTLDELDSIYGLRGKPLKYWIFRYRQAIAEYEVGHLARLEALAARLALTPGLFITGSSYRGIAVNACMKEAGPTAERVREHLAARRGAAA